MSDDDEANAKPEFDLAQLARDMAEGVPILMFFIDEPFKVLVGPAGELVLDFPWTSTAGYATAAMARAVMPLAAAGRLKAILSEMKSIPDMPPEGPGPRSAN